MSEDVYLLQHEILVNSAYFLEPQEFLENFKNFKHKFLFAQSSLINIHFLDSNFC